MLLTVYVMQLQYVT